MDTSNERTGITSVDLAENCSLFNICPPIYVFQSSWAGLVTLCSGEKISNPPMESAQGPLAVE